MESKVACNIILYPEYIKSLLENYGHGSENSHVYSGVITHLEISISACYHAYFAYMLGGLIRRVACKIRPYEFVEGQTDQAVENSISILEQAFLGKKNMDSAVAEAVALFDDIPHLKEERPKVALFGDFYVCDNDVMNQNINHAIEEAGGEVITLPYSDYAKITRDNVFRRFLERGEYLKGFQFKLVVTGLRFIEEIYYKHFTKHLGNPTEIDPKKLEAVMAIFAEPPR